MPRRIGMRVTIECYVCSQSVPSDNGRVAFHLARDVLTGNYKVCTGSQEGTPKSQRKKKPYYTFVPVTRVCPACQRGDHLLCDDCECEKCSYLDLPH